MEILYRGLNVADCVPIRLYFYGSKKVEDQPEDPLHTAIRSGKFDVASSLIDEMEQNDERLDKYAVDPEINHSHPPVMYAARYGSVEVLKKLIAKGANVGAKRDCPFTDINGLSAAQRHHNGVGLEICKMLIEWGVRADEGTKKNVTPIYSSIIWNNVPVALLLLDNGADANAFCVNHECDRPMFMAAAHGNASILRLLVEDYGADPNLIGTSGYNLYHHSLVGGNVELIDICANFGLDINSVANSEDTPLSLACKLPNDLVKIEMIQKILEHGGKPEIATSDGPPMLIAIANDRWEVVHLMLRFTYQNNPERMAHVVNCMMRESQVTPLIASIRKLHGETVKLLLSYNADIYKRDFSGNTTLIEAVKVNDVELVYNLLKAGAKIETTNHFNDSALSIAVNRNYSACAELLVREWIRRKSHTIVNSDRMLPLSDAVVSRMKIDILNALVMPDVFSIELAMLLLRMEVVTTEDIESALSKDRMLALVAEINWIRRKSYLMFYSGYIKALCYKNYNNNEDDRTGTKSTKGDEAAVRDIVIPLIFQRVVKYL